MRIVSAITVVDGLQPDGRVWTFCRLTTEDGRTAVGSSSVKARRYTKALGDKVAWLNARAVFYA